MSRRAARFTQPELRRAAKVAKKEGMSVKIVDGEIHLTPVGGGIGRPQPPVDDEPVRIV